MAHPQNNGRHTTRRLFPVDRSLVDRAHYFEAMRNFSACTVEINLRATQAERGETRSIGIAGKTTEQRLSGQNKHKVR